MLGMGGSELVIVLLAVLILFGAKRIPEFAKGLGQGIKEFKKASSGVTNEFHNAMNQELAASAPLKPLPLCAVPDPMGGDPKFQSREFLQIPPQ